MLQRNIFSQKQVAFVELASAQLMISCGIVIAKKLLPALSLFLLQGFRFTLSSIFLFCLMHQKKENFRLLLPLLRPTHKGFWLLFFQALCGGFLFNIFMIGGLQYSSASVAGIIASTVPAMILIMSIFLLKEKINQQQLLSILLAVFGLLIIALNQAKGDYQHKLIGDFLMLMAIIPEALFTVLAKWRKTVLDPLQLSLLMCVINALIFLPFAIYTFDASLWTKMTTSLWTLLFIYSIAGALFFLLWYRGLMHHSTTTAAVLTSLMPLATAFLAVIFLHEKLTMAQYVGMSCVVVSILLGSGFSFYRKAKLSTTSNRE